MKILTISGSPRRQGHTARALDFLEKELLTLGHQTERVNVVDYTIHGCLGCNACFKEKAGPVCVQNDDAQLIFDKIMKADRVVYASPLYSWSYTAQMKALIDRHYGMVTKHGSEDQSSVLENKPVALLITCSRPDENNSDLVQKSFDRGFEELKCKIAGKFTLPNSYEDDYPNRAQQTAQRLTEALINCN
jgi:multimeric flavodoxin WrbA